MAARDSTRASLQSRRILAAVAVLAVVWIGVYWATPPAPQPAAAITFDDPRDSREAARAPLLSPSNEPPPVVPPQASLATETPAPPPPEQATPAVIPPSFRERVVRPGETMESIAKAELGDATKWTIVASANPRIDPLKLRPGMTLRIPIDPTNIQGKPNPAHEANAPPPAAPDEPTRIEYVVRPGDTLGGIARTYYSSASKWRIILEANSDVLSRPEQLRPGMRLVIPPAPSN